MNIKQIISTTLLVTSCLALTLSAEVPRLITYQGRLIDTAGIPVADSTYDLTFIISTDSVPGGIYVEWFEDHTVPVADGLFTVKLGQSKPLPASVYTGNQLYVGMKYTGVSNPEFSPRIPITTTAYALKALMSDTADFADRAAIADSATVLLGGTGWVDDGAVVRLESGSDRVGIRTTTASEPLVVSHDLGSYNGEYVVVGNSDFEGYSGYVLGYNADNRAMLRWYGDGMAASFHIRSTGQNFNNVLTVGPGQVGVNTDGGSAALNVNGDGWFSGDVGIGTSSPAGKLHVVGSGNDAVQLPTDAISSQEMLNESGVGTGYITETILSQDYSIVYSRQLTFPTSGWAIVLATVQWEPTIVGQFTDFTISESPVAEGPLVYQMASEGAWHYLKIITMHSTFEITSPGSKTFYLLGKDTYEDLFQSHVQGEMSVLFVPTYYGTSKATAAGNSDLPERVMPSPAPDYTTLDIQPVVAQYVKAETDALRAEFDAKLRALRDELAALKSGR